VGRDPETCRHKLEVLQRHCETVGRDYDEIITSAEADIFLLREEEDPETATAPVRGEKSLAEFSRGKVVGTPEQVQAHVQALSDAGINYVIVYMPNLAHDREPIGRFADEVIAAFT
jgi:alkanesulfonate monooxygenase SsuD/methylene tetrahydromethanopterin reductase-like flavin-dependent oxidoreductase (luciferase family)